MSILTIIILWTWGLSPLWVNIVGTIICSLGIFTRFCYNYNKWKDKESETNNKR